MIQVFLDANAASSGKKIVTDIWKARSGVLSEDLNLLQDFFFPQCHHMFSRTSWSALWRWRSVTDFSGSDAYEARIRRPDDVSGDI
jgi:hypothetical protein